eukprot:11226172-Lingulodinium_polyedra.AAC.1
MTMMMLIRENRVGLMHCELPDPGPAGLLQLRHEQTDLHGDERRPFAPVELELNAECACRPSDIRLARQTYLEVPG